MGIDIYARWRDQTGDEEEAQYKAGFDSTVGDIGYHPAIPPVRRLSTLRLTSFRD